MVNEWNKSTVECIERMNIEVKKKVNALCENFRDVSRSHMLGFLDQVWMSCQEEQNNARE